MINVSNLIRKTIFACMLLVVLIYMISIVSAFDFNLDSSITIGSENSYLDTGADTDCPIWQSTCDFQDNIDNVGNEIFNISLPNSQVMCTQKLTIEVKNLENILVKESLTGQEKSTNGMGFVDFNLNKVVCDETFDVTGVCQNSGKSCKKITTYSKDGFKSENLDCSVCLSVKDLSISREDVFINKDKIKFKFKSLGIDSDVDVILRRQGINGIISDEKTILVNTNHGWNNNIYSGFNNLETGEYIHITLDKISGEETYDNNYVIVPIIDNRNKIYLEVNFGDQYSILDDVVYDYFNENFNLVSTLKNAKFHVVVGDLAILKYNSKLSLENLKITNKNWGKIHSAGIKLINMENPDKFGSQTLSRIEIIGNGLQGTIAGIKRIVNNNNAYFTSQGIVYGEKSIDLIDNYDKLGLSVLDFINKKRLGNNLYENNDVLAKAVSDVLSDNNVETKFKIVKTNNVDTSYKDKQNQLRLKNLNIDYSRGFRDTFELNKYPVVMSGGLFSNIETFDSFGRELVLDGQTVWLMEMTGGPETECDTCPNYKYDDLVNSHWPASIAGVQYYSGFDKVNYVGHSNGCRAALSSLNSYSSSGKPDAGQVLIDGVWTDVDMSELPVDKFFGIACPINLNDYSYVKRNMIKYLEDEQDTNGNTALNELTDENKTHILQQDLSSKLKWGAGLIANSDYKISLNLQKYYYGLYNDNFSVMDLNNININKFNIFGGTKEHPFEISEYINRNLNDGAVPVSDIWYVYDNINLNLVNKDIFFEYERHTPILKNDNVRTIIGEKLK